MPWFQVCAPIHPVFFKSVDEGHRKVFIDLLLVLHYHQSEVCMDTTFHSVGAKTEINVLLLTEVNIVLVQGIIEAFIKILHVEEDDSTPSLHARFHPVHITADLGIFLVLWESRTKDYFRGWIVSFGKDLLLKDMESCI